MLQHSRIFTKKLIRGLSQTSSSLKLHHLQKRCLIRVSGNDVSDFLQGLLTNDIKHLDGPGSMFTMYLNTKGRVLYDSIIYKTNESNMFLVECDTKAVEPLQKHLKMYRVRRKVDISNVADQYDIFALFNPSAIHQSSAGVSVKGLEGAVAPCDALTESLPNNTSSTKFHKDLIVYRDPRLVHLGSRIISKKDANVTDQLEEIILDKISTSTESDYRRFRYTLGVGEGVTDLPSGDCFPLECNCDYLHGVSFHKGCYIGQELTARTHHTGVVRKRLMPLFFKKIPTKLPEDDKIMEGGANLGKFRGIENDIGLALLRIAKVLELKEFSVGDGVAYAGKPNWWPIEAPKERIGLQKS